MTAVWKNFSICPRHCFENSSPASFGNLVGTTSFLRPKGARHEWISSLLSPPTFLPSKKVASCVPCKTITFYPPPLLPLSPSPPSLTLGVKKKLSSPVEWEEEEQAGVDREGGKSLLLKLFPRCFAAVFFSLLSLSLSLSLSTIPLLSFKPTMPDDDEEEEESRRACRRRSHPPPSPFPVCPANHGNKMGFFHFVESARCCPSRPTLLLSLWRLFRLPLVPAPLGSDIFLLLLLLLRPPPPPSTPFLKDLPRSLSFAAKRGSHDGGKTEREEEERRRHFLLSLSLPRERLERERERGADVLENEIWEAGGALLLLLLREGGGKWWWWENEVEKADGDRGRGNASRPLSKREKGESPSSARVFFPVEH